MPCVGHMEEEQPTFRSHVHGDDPRPPVRRISGECGEAQPFAGIEVDVVDARPEFDEAWRRACSDRALRQLDRRVPAMVRAVDRFASDRAGEPRDMRATS